MRRDEARAARPLVLLGGLSLEHALRRDPRLEDLARLLRLALLLAQRGRLLALGRLDGDDRGVGRVQLGAQVVAHRLRRLERDLDDAHRPQPDELGLARLAALHQRRAEVVEQQRRLAVGADAARGAARLQPEQLPEAPLGLRQLAQLVRSHRLALEVLDEAFLVVAAALRVCRRLRRPRRRHWLCDARRLLGWGVLGLRPERRRARWLPPLLLLPLLLDETVEEARRLRGRPARRHGGPVGDGGRARRHDGREAALGHGHAGGELGHGRRRREQTGAERDAAAAFEVAHRRHLGGLARLAQPDVAAHLGGGGARLGPQQQQARHELRRVEAAVARHGLGGQPGAHLLHEAGDRRRVEGQAAREQRVQDDAARPHVGHARVVRVRGLGGREDLGRRVERRAARLVRERAHVGHPAQPKVGNLEAEAADVAREPLAAHERRRRRRLDRPLDGARGGLGGERDEHQVLELEVAVVEAERVAEVEAAHELLEQAARLAVREIAARLEQLREIARRAVVHHERDLMRRRDPRVQPDDVRMAELLVVAHLGLQQLVRVALELGAVDDLDGDALARAQRRAEQHPRKRSLTELAVDVQHVVGVEELLRRPPQLLARAARLLLSARLLDERPQLSLSLGHLLGERRWLGSGLLWRWRRRGHLEPQHDVVVVVRRYILGFRWLAVTEAPRQRLA